MFTDNGCNLYKRGEEGGDETVAEAVNRPHGGRRMAPLHQRLQRRSCSNVSLYGAPWQQMTKCKCNLPQKPPMLLTINYPGTLGGPHPTQRSPQSGLNGVRVAPCSHLLRAPSER